MAKSHRTSAKLIAMSALCQKQTCTDKSRSIPGRLLCRPRPERPAARLCLFREPAGLAAPILLRLALEAGSGGRPSLLGLSDASVNNPVTAVASLQTSLFDENGQLRPTGKWPPHELSRANSASAMDVSFIWSPLAVANFNAGDRHRTSRAPDPQHSIEEAPTTCVGIAGASFVPRPADRSGPPQT
jgi:hypothetical protein